MRVDGRRNAPSGAPTVSRRRRWLGPIVTLLLIVALLLVELTRSERVDGLLSTCANTEALVAIVAWSVESAEWNPQGQIRKGLADYACVPTETMHLRVDGSFK